MPVRLAKIFFYVLCITFCWLPVSSHTTIQYTYDQNGNLISGDGKYYEYNDANKLIRVRYQDSSGPVIAEYVYDHSGQRIKKIEDGITTYYVGKHFEKQVGTGNAKETKYYFANNARIAKKDQDGSLSFYHLDHLGSTSAVTDDSGNLKEKSRYFPFGDIRSGGSAQYTYTGKEKDKTTDSYYFEARYYGPTLRHFTQPDWVSLNLYDPQNLNRYAYVKNNPLKYNDPSGNTFSLSELFRTIFGIKTAKAPDNNSFDDKAIVNTTAASIESPKITEQAAATQKEYEYQRYQDGKAAFGNGLDGQCTQYAKKITGRQGALGTTWEQKKQYLESSSDGYRYDKNKVDVGDILLIDLDYYLDGVEINHVAVVNEVDRKNGVLILTEQNRDGKNTITHSHTIPIDSNKIWGGYHTDLKKIE